MSRLMKAAVVALTVLFAGVTIAPVVEAHPSTVSPKKSKGKRGASAKAAPKAAKKASASALAKKKNAKKKALALKKANTKKKALALKKANAKKKALALKKANAKKLVKKPTPKIPAKAPPKKGP